METKLLLGAPGADELPGCTRCTTTNSGAAYVYRDTSGDGNWISEGKLIASDAESFDKVGFSVAIDGNWIVAGAISCTNLDILFCTPGAPGAAYVYEFTSAGEGCSPISETTKLTACEDPPSFNDLFLESQ